jgi:arsenite oxidase small subunit
MDRRNFLESCSLSAACAASTGTVSAVASLALAGHALAADAKPKRYDKVMLCDATGAPLKAASLKPQVNYVFHYPFQATPVFLLDLGQAAAPVVLNTKDRQSYAWPGGVGPRKSLVAFSAICAHKLVYPTPQLSFISFRKSKANNGLQDNLIHCCADHSQYDPAQGSKVLSGPAPQPLCAVLIEHDAASDSLTAVGTLGGELFDEFFKKYEFKLSMDVGAKAKDKVLAKATVTELEKFCSNTVSC